MKKNLLFCILFNSSFLISYAQWNQLGSDMDGQAANERFGYANSINAAGTVLAVGATLAKENSVIKGKASVYEWNGSSWIQRGLDIFGSNAGDDFGEALSISANGNSIAVGAPTNSNGYTRILEWNGTNWLQKGSDIIGEANNDRSGTAMSLSANGTTVAIGASSNAGANGSFSGHCRIFEWNGTNWIQKGTDIDGETASDFSGSAVAINAAGTIVAIGAAGNDGNGSGSGHVRVYEWNGTAWIQKGADVNGDTTNANQGYTLSMDASGTTFITGGYSFSNAALGFTKVFSWNGTSWVQKGQTLLGTGSSDFLGTAVDISDDGSIIASSALTGTANGLARVYKFVSNNWVQQGTDILGEASGDQLGRSLSLSANGSRIALGTPYNDGNGSDAGHARIYENPNLLNTTTFQNKNSLFVYPNPAQDFIAISGVTTEQKYTLFSVLGVKISSGTSTNNQKIDIQNLSNGIYFLKMDNGMTIKFCKE
jgi:hypothetical protein